MNWQAVDPVLKIWLVFWLNRALGVVGPGLAALNITPSGNTAALMAGVVITAIHFVVAYLQTQWALKQPPKLPTSSTQVIKYPLPPTSK